ncbi:EAL domain-containing protein [Tahibacter amnicola]|uniref:EAL domain-containing protein n=1 Tax=Tahibacter amnicola TaxID=2976241 RepID=A0ABY6BFF8_9GAMM|nr:EAL domain-containing protein [Tahibacter amnicola]UXI68764.1 EAL domain-containing protein [Tahibacter amnicola]
MRSARRTDVPPVDYRRLLSLTWPYLGIVALVVAVAGFSMDIMSACRAYVGGEAMWSKGQKRASAALDRYTRTRDPADFDEYRRAVEVTLGDRLARVELDKRRPDLVIARAGFLRGRNHPDDIPSMIRLFRNFRGTADVDRAIAFWADGDALIDEMVQLGDEIHASLTTGSPVLDLDAVRARLWSIDARLTPLQEGFSQALAQLSRRTQTMLALGIVAASAVLVLIAVWRTRRMLAENEQFERNSRLNEERFQRAVTGSSDGLWDFERDDGSLYLSPRFIKMLELDPALAPRHPGELLARVHPEDRAPLLRCLRLHLTRGLRFDAECRLRRRDGHYCWLRVRGHAERDGDGRVLRVSGSAGDIADRKKAEAQLFAEKERAQVTLASIGDAVIATDIHGSVEYLNPVAESLTGWTNAQARGLPLAMVCDIDDEATGSGVRDPVEAVLRERGTVALGTKLLLRRRNGGTTPIDETATPIRDRDGEIDGVVLVFRDVSRERQYSETLSYQASHDLLTGLYNRHEFERRLDLALQQARLLQRPYALLYIDLDQFKLVNDTAGHAAGDEMLRQIGKLLQRQVREDDVVARLGGDEFVVLLDNCPPDAAQRVAQKLRQAIAEQPYHCGQRHFTAHASIGLLDLGSAPLTRDDVLGIADAACYVAKDQGRDRVHRYHPDDTLLNSRRGEMAWVERLHRAFERGQLRLYRQDIVPLGAEPYEGSHFEVLLRLEEEDRVIVPMAFIPAAERYGLMPLLDRWVIRAAFHRMALARRVPGGERISLCAINLSGASLADDSFVDYAKEQFIHFGISPESICFEITETVAISDLNRAASFVQELRALGCRFALDDFGVGMSSLTYLKTLPVDFLKIDGSFVRDMRSDAIDRAMVEAIHRVGQVTGKATIAEMVEDAATLEEARMLGIGFAQGYAVAKPRPFLVAAAAAPVRVGSDDPS